MWPSWKTPCSGASPARYGCTTGPDAELLVFRPLAEQCAAALPGFQVCYYAETGFADGIVVMAGRIDLDAICRGLADPRRTIFYLCGPQPMIEAFTTRLADEFCVPAENVKTDHWE